MIKTEQILRYWFGVLDNELSNKSQSILWYQSTPEIDQEIFSQFNHLYQQSISGKLAHWHDNARSSLAMIILLDQLPRNMFRGTAQAFASDSQALLTAQKGIDRGFDKELSLIERIFYYHPFEHSEDLSDQQKSVDLFSSLLDDYSDDAHQTVIKSSLNFAQQHLTIIEKFGRFPHRNQVLKRQSTAAEIDYLKTGNSFGQAAKK